MMKLRDFKTEVQGAISNLENIIYKMPQKGDKAENCQKLRFIQAINEIGYILNGTKAIDLEVKAKEQEFKDLFQFPDEWSKELRKVLVGFNSKDATYDLCKKLKKNLKPLGLTFEYYPEAEPFDLRPMHFLKSVKTLIDADSNCYPCKIDKTPHVEGEFSLRDTNFIRIWINLLSVEDLRYLRCYHEFTY